MARTWAHVLAWAALLVTLAALPSSPDRAERAPTAIPASYLVPLSGPAGQKIWSIPLYYPTTWYLEGEALFWWKSASPLTLSVYQESQLLGRCHSRQGRFITPIVYYKAAKIDSITVVVDAASPFTLFYR